MEEQQNNFSDSEMSLRDQDSRDEESYHSYSEHSQTNQLSYFPDPEKALEDLRELIAYAYDNLNQNQQSQETRSKTIIEEHHSLRMGPRSHS